MSCFGVLCTVILELATYGSSPSKPVRKPPSATPTRTPAEIAQAADRFLAAKRIDLTHRRAEKPEYHPDLGSWLIAYPTSRAVALGEGTFGVFVNDDDITRIRLTPSR